jgi:hypothetical protein
VEYPWAWSTRQAMANLCPNVVAELSHLAGAKLKSAQRRQVIAACWTQTSVFKCTKLRNAQRFAQITPM